MFIVFYVIVYLVFGKKAKKKAEEQKQRDAELRQRYGTGPQTNANTNYTYRSASSAGASRSTAAAYSYGNASSRAQAQSYHLDSSHYHKEGYDFATCFSFKDVPQGADELSALIAANSRHERELEKLLHTRD